MQGKEDGVFVGVLSGNVTLRIHAGAPAAATAPIFGTRQHFYRFFGFKTVVVAGDGRQVARQRPLCGQVELAEFVVKIGAVGLQVDFFIAPVFVTGVQYFARLGQVADADGVIFGTFVVLVVMDAAVEGETAAYAAGCECHPVGTVARIPADAAVKHDCVVLEIELLTDASAEPFFSGRVVENTALHGGGKAVCGINPVVAVIEVFAEQLTVAETVFG